MAHRGPFRCECGELHNEYDASNDLEQYIDTEGVSCLNEAVAGSCRLVLLPPRRRGDEEIALLSTDGDAELLIHVPFVVAVKVSALVIRAGVAGAAPSRVRAFVNQDGIDFSDVADRPAVQEWDVADGGAELEYATVRAKFQNVSALTLHVNGNHAGDDGETPTCIAYLAFKGEGTPNRRGIVDALYEVRPVARGTALPAASAGAASF